MNDASPTWGEIVWGQFQKSGLAHPSSVTRKRGWFEHRRGAAVASRNSAATPHKEPYPHADRSRM